VVAEHDPKSSGSETTFARDLTDTADMRAEIEAMARDAAAWLLRRELYAKTVTIKVRYHDFTTITRSHSDHPTRTEEEIVTRALGLLERTEVSRRPVRLLGVSVHGLTTTRFPPEPPDRLPFET
jgi:DNA polymerase-4